MGLALENLAHSHKEKKIGRGQTNEEKIRM
jgi:hypothetical protein